MNSLKIFNVVFVLGCLVFILETRALAQTVSKVSPLSEKRAQYKAAAEAYLAKYPEKKAGLDEIPAGNVKASFVTGDGETQTITLMGRDLILEEIGSAIVRYADPVNREKILKDLYGLLTSEQKKKLKFSSFDQLKAMGPAEAKSAIKSMAELIALGPVVFEPQNLAAPPECAEEIGYENGSDCMYYSERPCSHGDWDVGGLIARYVFPLEKHLTCVKHQGERGTCTAFAVNGALEIEVSKQFGDKVNLSEQHLYWYYKKRIENEGDQDADGANGETLLEETMSRGYEHQLESAWNYNPSWERITDADGDYDDSCLDYSGEYCTDTVHQGKRASSTSIVEKLSGSGPMAESPFSKEDDWSNAVVTGDGYVNRGVTELMDMDDRDASLLTAAAYLDASRPVIVTLHANTSFISNPSGHAGFMQVSSADRDSYGHAILAVGYLSCSEMYPGTTMMGKFLLESRESMGCRITTGGGYFIMKNSWGPTYGDEGYVYIPYSWARDWFYHLVAVDEGLD